MSVDDYFDDLDPPLQDIAIELRRLVFAAIPDAKEALKWSVPTYSVNKNICSIIAHKKQVNLQIFRGAQIKSSNLLEGTGKDMRHLKIFSADDIEKGRVEQCLKQAMELDS